MDHLFPPKFGSQLTPILVTASRDCFPKELADHCCQALLEALRMENIQTVRYGPVIENSGDVEAVVNQIQASDPNNRRAVILYLGNFSPEKEDARLIQALNGLGITPMIIAAAEEGIEAIRVHEDGSCNRRDTLCGLLSAIYNCWLGELELFIPTNPVCDIASQVGNIQHFLKVQAVVQQVQGAKVGIIDSHPNDFATCEVQESGLRRLGAEITNITGAEFRMLMEQVSTADADLVAMTATEMKDQLGPQGIGIADDALLAKMALYEVTVRQLAKKHRLRACAGECWPMFEPTYGHVPCYPDSRLDASGFPMVCEGDGWGALGQLMMQTATGQSATLLDVNNTVPEEMLAARGIPTSNCFQAFHCGRTAQEHLCDGCQIKRQLIMERLMGPKTTGGTLEGTIKASPTTMFRLHHSPIDNGIQAYIAQGRFMDIDPITFGGVGTVYIPEFARFYRWILLQLGFPHHAVFGFEHCAAALFDALLLLGIPANRIHYNQAPTNPYPGENPWSNPALVAQ